MAFIEINKSSIIHNLRFLHNFCNKRKIQLCAVTKCCCSEEEIISLIYDSGINEIADSNQENFKRLPVGLAGNLRKSVIKTRLTDIQLIPSLPASARPQRVFISDEIMLKALAGISPDICPGIMLITEVGDFRDGFYPQQLSSICRKYSDLPIIGIAANYACLSGKMPGISDAHLLSQSASEMITRDGALPLVSLGGTVAYPLFNSDGFRVGGHNSDDKCAWELRIGEGIFLGCNPATGINIPGFKPDAFTFFGEILEIREKEYSESENKGYNALGEKGAAFKSGKRLNMVLDFGVLAAPAKTLCPLDISAEIVGQTYDFTVVDITESSQKYKAGQHIGFTPSYGALSHAMLNNYVNKVYKK